MASAYPQSAPFSSPEWIGHLAEKDSDSILIWAVRDRGGSLLGVVPTTKRDYQLTFDVANRVFARISFKVAEVLGNPPCIPSDQSLFDTLITSILDFWTDRDGICFDALPSGDLCCDLIHKLDRTSNAWRIYSPFGRRPWHLITLGVTFEDYLSKKSAKSRSTLRRKVRQFEQSGDIHLQRYTEATDVPAFLEGVCQVSRKTWQHRLLGHGYINDEIGRSKYLDLASRGLLRSYVLWRNSCPCAYVIGYQYRDVYYYADVGFDPALSEHSPGTVLLFLLLEDLHETDRPSVLNFGIGDACYKQRFGTDVGSDETVLVLRAGLRNRFAIRSHQAFITCLEQAKRLIGRRVQK